VNNEIIIKALSLLGRVLEYEGEKPSGKISLIVCGGAALVARSLVQRVTNDVDVVALLKNGELVSPAPLPVSLLLAAEKVADGMNLPKDWPNNGPSSGVGGLFKVGLPDGLEARLGVFLSGGFSERRGSSCCILQQSVHVASSRNDL
jgi:hypothetical protein